MNFVGLNVNKFESQLNPYRRVQQAISWKIGQLENELVSKLISIRWRPTFSQESQNREV